MEDVRDRDEKRHDIRKKRGWNENIEATAPLFLYQLHVFHFEDHRSNDQKAQTVRCLNVCNSSDFLGILTKSYRSSIMTCI